MGMEQAKEMTEFMSQNATAHATGLRHDNKAIFRSSRPGKGGDTTGSLAKLGIANLIEVKNIDGIGVRAGVD